MLNRRVELKIIKLKIDIIMEIIKDIYMKKIRITLIITLASLMMCTVSWAATYYIDGSNGNDANPGTVTQPWKTIGKANSTLKAGDTVYIKNGTYNETIQPSRSGTAGNYIKYASKGNDEVIITGSSDGINLSNKSYIIIDGLNIEHVSGNWVDFQPNGSHNIIQNCYMKESANYVGIALLDGAKYNKIINNTMIGNCGPNDLMQIWNSSYNLIEGNELYYGTHDSIDIQDRRPGTTNYNIIRDNYIQNKWHSNIDINAVEYIMIEGNTIVDAGEDHKDNACGSVRDRTMAREFNKGLQLMSSYSIVRNNVIVNNGHGISLCSGAGSANTKYPWKNPQGNNRVYNNTVVGNYIGIMRNDPSALVGKTYLLNNIIYDNHGTEISYMGPSDAPNSVYITNNDIFPGTIDIRQPSACIINKKFALNPQFKDISNRNFHLKSNSPMINAGMFLTTTTNSGSGSTAIAVKDARFFMDGWGIIKGDTVQIEGQTETATVKNVDYQNNIITINAPLSWTAGKGISLAFQGSAPDVGAFEFNNGNSGNTLQPPSNLRVAKVQ